MKIAVFGSAAPKSGSKEYLDAYQLGEKLAKRGHIVLNGGYCGTMEAVSKGAYQANGYVIGSVCDDIEVWRKTKPNPWLSEEWRFATLPERLSALVQNCDAAIALPGGIGTLSEILLYWNMLIIAENPQANLILVGIGWKEIIDHLQNTQSASMHQNVLDLLHFSANIDEALQILDKITP